VEAAEVVAEAAVGGEGAVSGQAAAGAQAAASAAVPSTDRVLVSARGEAVHEGTLMALCAAAEVEAPAEAPVDTAESLLRCMPVDEAEEAPSASGGTCALCCDRGMDAVFYRCGHQCACMQCAYYLLHQRAPCPICRAPVEDVVRLFPVR